MEEPVFDRLFDRMARRITHSPKGQLRRHLLTLQLAPFLDAPSLRVLDAGGGFGDLSEAFGSRGHRVTYLDESSKMVDAARDRFNAAGLTIEAIRGRIEDFSPAETYDLVLCHGVIAWTAKPKTTLRRLCDFVAPGGTLSLLFYNRDRLALRVGAAGDYQVLLSDRLGGTGRTLTPLQPLRPSEVDGWLGEIGMVETGRWGLRIFAGLGDGPDIAEGEAPEGWIEAEERYSGLSPFRDIAQHIHLTCRKPSYP